MLTKQQMGRMSVLAAVTLATSVALISAASPAAAATPIRGTFTPVDPVRVLDTRDGTGVAEQHRGPVGAGQVIELDVTGVGGVPDSGVGAVVLNVTVTEARGRGFVTVYPCGNARPLASNVNVTSGVAVANLVTAKVGRDGRVCFFASIATEIVGDLSGWYGDDFAAVPGFFYHPVDPTRIVDTRVTAPVPEAGRSHRSRPAKSSLSTSPAWAVYPTTRVFVQSP